MYNHLPPDRWLYVHKIVTAYRDAATNGIPPDIDAYLVGVPNSLLPVILHELAVVEYQIKVLSGTQLQLVVTANTYRLQAILKRARRLAKEECSSCGIT